MSNLGCYIKKPKEINVNEWLYGEDQGRYIIISESNNTETIINEANKNNISITVIGKVEENSFIVEHNNSKQEISIDKLSNLRNNWFNNYFEK